MAFDRKAAERRFEDFMMAMDDQLDWLETQAASLGVRLDGTTADIDRLESLFDRMSEGKPKSEVDGLVIVFARCLGELVCKHWGGQWALAISDPNSINFDMPVIVGHSPVAGLEFSPIQVTKAYALRRKPGTLAKAVHAQVAPKPLDLSDLAG